MIICDKFCDCVGCKWRYSDKREDAEDGRNCEHLTEVDTVRHGTWEDASVKDYGSVHYSRGYVRCTLCNTVQWLGMDFKYCPVCGARMDGAE